MGNEDSDGTIVAGKEDLISEMLITQPICLELVHHVSPYLAVGGTRNPERQV